ncbi:MAG TPA: CsbD family protein [Bryobacteraceae bacterium]|nr:CsbD family protein [Bryobacteraceae bacterium]
MNWDQIEGKWKQFAGSARERWGKLTDNDWHTVGGKKDQLVGRIQERYGIAKEEAERQTDEWMRTLKVSEHDVPPATRHAGTRTDV